MKFYFLSRPRKNTWTERLIVAILHNNAKQSLFSVAERMEMLEEVVRLYRGDIHQQPFKRSDFQIAESRAT